MQHKEEKIRRKFTKIDKKVSILCHNVVYSNRMFNEIRGKI